MSTKNGAIDFNELAREVNEARWGQDKLAIWGGWCAETDVLSLVQNWPNCDTVMPYRIWEHTSEILFEEKKPPTNINWLERGRLFGPGGDITLRRHGDHFRWHFIGTTGTQPPAGNFDAKNFWDQAPNQATTFHQCEERALLWGERKKDFDLWFEDRTNRAKLKYPSNLDGRLQVNYQTFSRSGRVEFVWLLGLEAYHG